MISMNTYVTAVTDCILLFINADSLTETCEKACPCHRKLIGNLICVLCNQITELKNNNSFMAIKGMRRKIAKFIYDKYLEQDSRIVQLGVDRNGMAKYLNVSRPSMSREMINMREEGIFDFRKEIVTIKDLDSLRQIALDD